MLKVILLILMAISDRPTTPTCAAMREQCGGIGWTGPTQCCAGSTCHYNDSDYSECLPASTPSPSAVNTSEGPVGLVQASTASKATVESTTTSAVNDSREDGVTTRYWDCCKASCGWPRKASVTSPVQTCARDGITVVDAPTRSGCNGGTGYMCNNQQPWSLSTSVSYGFAAAHITGQGESDWCCACYSLLFTTGPVAGKEMIVQVTNTGADLRNNHFDLQMPGGGVGLFDGCSGQFPEVSKSSWGQQYGGISARDDCAKLPAVLQAGCLWRFDWFMNADNPQIRFKKVPCPLALTAKTRCNRT